MSIQKYFQFIIVTLLISDVFGQNKLPLILINSTQTIQDEPKVRATLRIIDNGPSLDNNINDSPKYEGNIGIEYRGSTSQWFPKKPYGIEIWNNQNEDIDTSMLGMPAESDWILNAMYNDKSLMREALTYKLGRSIMDYAPRTRYCEVYINNQYEGIYMLTEKIKRGKKRVDIDKLLSTSVTGDEITGGYIIKFDKDTGGDAVSWNSTHSSIPNLNKYPLFQLEYPSRENTNQVQIDYIKNFMSNAENAMKSSNFDNAESGFRKYFDEESLIDFIILNELAKNGDGYRLSTYFYKERDSDGGKLKMGPLWDFNLAYGNIDYCSGPSPEGLVLYDFNRSCQDDFWVVHFWWERLMQDKVFVENLKKRYTLLRQEKMSNAKINSTIDSFYQLMQPSVGRNFSRWQILGEYVWPNSFIGKTHIEEVDFLREWLRKRLIYLDGLWLANEATLDDDPSPMVIIPNPSKVASRLIIAEPSSIKEGPMLTNSLGQVIAGALMTKITDNEWDIQLDTLMAGVYFISYIDINDKKYSKAIVKQ
jgi:hypothetical protein